MILCTVGLNADLCMFYVFKAMDAPCCIENDLVELAWSSPELPLHNENLSSTALFDWKWQKKVMFVNSYSDNMSVDISISSQVASWLSIVLCVNCF